MQHWLESRYEVFAKRDAAYVKSLVREVQSELGKLELLYDGEQLVGIQGIWGREKKEQRLLYTETGYSELETKKPAAAKKAAAKKPVAKKAASKKEE